MIIENKTNTIKYFDLSNYSFVDKDKKVSKCFFTEESVSSHIYNVNNFVCDLNDYKSVLPNIIPIPPRSKYLFEDGVFKKLNHGYIFKNPSYDLLVKFLKRLLKLTNGKIAVELSGGLDTSIIIGVLKDVGFQPVLIGAEYDLYEFRTERIIQSLVSSSFDNVILYKPKRMQFSDLLTTPSHLLPDFSSLYHSMCVESIEYLRSRDVKCILHGTGFDALLIKSITCPSDDIDWPYLTENWLNDNVYNSYGMSYFDPSSINTIKRIVISVRAGSSIDVRKLWARQFFSHVIPSELSNYQYKANFGSVWFSSLEAARKDIGYLIDFALNLTRINEFKNFSFDGLFDVTNQKLELKPLAILSYASWVHALSSSGKLL